VRSLGVGMSRCGVAAGVVGLWLLLVCSPSLATTSYRLEGAFGGQGLGNGLFSPRPIGIGAFGASGGVFVADARDGQPPYGRLQRFDGSGEFVSSLALADVPGIVPYQGVSALAVDPSGAVYVFARIAGSAGSDVLKFNVVANDQLQFAYKLDEAGSGTTFVVDDTKALAVNPVDGSVYVTAIDGNGLPVIDSFDSMGAFITSFDGSNGAPDGGFAAPCTPSFFSPPPSSMAIDSAQRLYVLDPCKNRVDRYTAAGVYDGTVDNGSSRGDPKAVAVDPVSGEVFVAEAGNAAVYGLGAPHVTQFAAGGGAATSTFSLGDTFGIDSPAGVVGMAVDDAGTLYLADSTTEQVARFAKFDGPTVVTGGTVGTPGAREATVEGTIDPEGLPSTTYHFEYGQEGSGSYGSRTAEKPVSAGGGALPVSEPLTGLKPNTKYHYRLVGSNPSGSISDIPVPGPDQTLTTAPAPATVDGTPPAVSPAFASAIGPRSAVLYGTVNPNSSALAPSGFVRATLYHFEYGITAAYGNSSDDGVMCFAVFPDPTGTCGGDDLSVTAPLSGLLPGTTYHFRVVGDNGVVGPQAGADQTFTTAPVVGAGASDLTARRATLTGTIDPHGVATTYHFNYGPTTSYGTSTPEVAGGSGDGERVVTQQIAGLSPSTTYHVQVVSTSGGEIRHGADGLFRTLAAPVATALSPTGITTAAATLVGDADTRGVTGSYHFEVTSLDSSYSSTTAELPLAGNASAERVTAPVSGLPPAETFVVRLSVTSNDATELSDLVTFGTAALPRVFPTPPSGGGGVYGCGAPHLDAYNSRPRPGDTITVAGADLGVGGSAVLGDETVSPAAWSATSFKVDIPEDAAGALALTVDCGRRSNTIAITVFHQPVNRFSVTKVSVAGATATLSVKVPGPGKIETSGARTTAAKTTITRARTARVKVVLTGAGVRALGRAGSHQLRVGVQVRFTPAGGRRATKMVTVTYKHRAGR
jgi:hypothetical protein